MFIYKKKCAVDPNILLTEICNQRCPFCFAEDGMSNAKLKMMSPNNFHTLVQKLKKDNINTIRLLGGEPTLHPEFEKIIQIALKNFHTIMLFSNGFIPTKNQKIIKKNINRFIFNFNIGTPSFAHSTKQRNEAIRLMTYYSKETETNLGFTIWDLTYDYKKLFLYFSKATLKRVGIRFGYAKTIYNKKPLISKEQFSQVGTVIADLTHFFHDVGAKQISIDCGLMPTMFSNTDLKYVQSHAKIKGWGCSGKWGGIDIDTDLSAFPCYPKSKMLKISPTKLRTDGIDIFNKFYKSKMPQCYE